MRSGAFCIYLQDSGFLRRLIAGEGHFSCPALKIGRVGGPPTASICTIRIKGLVPTQVSTPNWRDIVFTVDSSSTPRVAFRLIGPLGVRAPFGPLLFLLTNFWRNLPAPLISNIGATHSTIQTGGHTKIPPPLKRRGSRI
jgi:hypothetical protein